MNIKELIGVSDLICMYDQIGVLCNKIITYLYECENIELLEEGNEYIGVRVSVSSVGYKLVYVESFKVKRYYIGLLVDGIVVYYVSGNLKKVGKTVDLKKFDYSLKELKGSFMLMDKIVNIDNILMKFTDQLYSEYRTRKETYKNDLDEEELGRRLKLLKGLLND